MMETINEWAKFWAGFMGYRFIDSTIVFLLIGGLWLWLRRKVSAQFGYFLFLLVLLKVVVPSGVSVPALYLYFFPNQTIQESFTVGGFDSWFLFGIGGEAPEEVQLQTSNTETTASGNTTKTPALSIVGMLMVGWMMIASLLLLRVVWCLWHTHRRLKHTVPLQGETYPIDLEKLRLIAGVKGPVRWVTCSWVNSPTVWGLFRPVIVVPSDLNSYLTNNQLKWVLLHELAHIRRGDNAVSLFQAILQAVFFFFPAVWIANIIVDQQREYACDDLALLGTRASRRDCGEGFLTVTLHIDGLPTFMPATLGMINYKTMIRSRLMRILDRKRILSSHLSSGGIISLWVLMFMVLLFGGRMAAAQVGEWIKAEVDFINSPPPRVLHGMAYDETREVIVMHGGVSYRKYLNDTWEWNGATRTWTNVSNEGPTRLAHAMAYDPVRDAIVVSGGTHLPNVFVNSETWEWDRTNWKLAAEEELSIIFPAMAYHPERKTIIRHGGFFDLTYDTYSGTMEWDGQQWKPLPDGPPLAKHRMVYDSWRNKMVVFGGFSSFGILSNDTWEFDGETWTKVAEGGPDGRFHPGMVFDSDQGVTVLFGGGLNPEGGFDNRSYSDMWQWNGIEWIQINTEGPTTNPNQNIFVNMAYDTRNHQSVLFGGGANSDTYRPNETWLFNFSSGIPKSVWLNY